MYFWHFKLHRLFLVFYSSWSYFHFGLWCRVQTHIHIIFHHSHSLFTPSHSFAVNVKWMRWAFVCFIMIYVHNDPNKATLGKRERRKREKKKPNTMNKWTQRPQKVMALNQFGSPSKTYSVNTMMTNVALKLKLETNIIE